MEVRQRVSRLQELVEELQRERAAQEASAREARALLELAVQQAAEQLDRVRAQVEDALLLGELGQLVLQVVAQRLEREKSATRHQYEEE